MEFRGERLGPREQARIRRYVAAHGRATRDELARGICELFGWRRPNREPPVRGARSLLERLERRGVLKLRPLRRRAFQRARPSEPRVAEMLVAGSAWAGPVDPRAPLVVRPIVESEVVGWRAYMERFHYLGDVRLVGESLRYGAWWGDELVGLVGWGAASLGNPARDRYLGWDRAAKARGLHQVVNNVRYLVLPWVRVPNLASRILGANLRRLSSDWEAVYGHRVLLAETFVDRSRFAGTCYRASNWRDVGETKGFGKRGAEYSYHGRRKTVFVYLLHRRSIEWLCAPPSAVAQRPEEVSMRTLSCVDLPIEGAQGLLAVLGTVPDPRCRRGIRHPLQSVLAVAVCGALAGQQSFSAIYEWAADQNKDLLKRLRCWRGRPPSERTLRRVLFDVDPEEIDKRVGAWLVSLKPLCGQALAIDGKTLRGSRDGEKGAVHLLAAVVQGSGAVVAQTRVDAKTNEIPCVAPLLGELDLRDVVVTGDALLTQREVARHLVEDKEADYVFTAKDNQPTLRQDIVDVFASEEEESIRRSVAPQNPPGTEAFPPSARDGGQGSRADRDPSDLDQYGVERVPGLPACGAGVPD